MKTVGYWVVLKSKLCYPGAKIGRWMVLVFPLSIMELLLMTDGWCKQISALELFLQICWSLFVLHDKMTEGFGVLFVCFFSKWENKKYWIMVNLVQLSAPSHRLSYWLEEWQLPCKPPVQGMLRNSRITGSKDTSGIWVALKMCNTGSSSLPSLQDTDWFLLLGAGVCQICCGMCPTRSRECPGLFSRVITREKLKEQYWADTFQNHRLSSTNLATTRGPGFLLGYSILSLKIFHLFNTDKGQKMTQEKVSLLLLILNIYTQLLLLVPARYPGKASTPGYGLSPISKRNLNRAAWHTLGMKWLWRVVSFGQLQELVLFAPGTCEYFLSPIPGVSGAFPLQGDQNPCLHASEWSTVLGCNTGCDQKSVFYPC